MGDEICFQIQFEFAGAGGEGVEPPFNDTIAFPAQRKTMALDIVKNATKLTSSIMVALIVLVACSQASTQGPTYGVKVQYALGQSLNFPDLTLEYVGKRESPASADYPRSIIFYDFKVYQGDRVQTISWSAGTGDIGPTLFELDGSRYALELAISDELGSLEKDELVLWRE